MCVTNTDTKIPVCPDVNNFPAPSQYNGGYVYTIAADWVELTCLGYPTGYPVPGLPAEDEIKADDGNVTLRMAQGGKGTKHYRHKYNIYVGEDKTAFASILVLPREGGVLQDNYNQLKIENEQLYVRGWAAKLRYVLSALSLRVNNVTRLDIALDGAGFFEVFNRFERGELEKVGKTTFATHKLAELEQVGEAKQMGALTFVTHRTAGRTLTGFDWGKRSSDKFLTCYNKTREMASGKKGYICQFWQANGLELEQVERLELKLKAEAIKKTVDPDDGEVGIKLERLEDGAYLAGIMRAHLVNYFDFVLPGNDTNVTRRERLKFIKWEAIGAEKLERLTSTKPANEVWRAKQAASKLIDDAEKLTEAVRAAIDDELITEVSDELVNAIIDEVRQHLKSSFLYKIPDECWTGLQSRIRKVLGSCIKAGISPETLRSMPVAIARALAKQHGQLSWLEWKKRLNHAHAF